jgi:hypothetical protein
MADQFIAGPGEVAGLVQIDPTFVTPISRLHVDEAFDDADGGITFSWAASLTELVANPRPPPPRGVVISRAFTVPRDAIERDWQPR